MHYDNRGYTVSYLHEWRRIYLIAYNCLYLNKCLMSYLGDADWTNCRPSHAIQYLSFYNYSGRCGGKMFS